jgi:hypothetical protein
MQSGTFTWDRYDAHHGEYAVRWLAESDRDVVLARLGIEHDDF